MTGPFANLGSTLPREIDGECSGFAWIGQAFTHCDNCSKPFWVHRYYMTQREGRSFRKLISKGEAAAVRQKWEGYCC